MRDTDRSGNRTDGRVEESVIFRRQEQPQTGTVRASLTLSLSVSLAATLFSLNRVWHPFRQRTPGAESSGCGKRLCRKKQNKINETHARGVPLGTRTAHSPPLACPERYGNGGLIFDNVELVQNETIQ